MVDTERPTDKLLLSLQERAKELNCLYEVERVLAQLDRPIDQALEAVVAAIPPGWQYPDVCRARITHGDGAFASPGFRSTPWEQTAPITVQDEAAGTITVCYLEERPREDIGPFLKEEQRLIQTIAERIGHFIFFRQLSDMRREWNDASRGTSARDTWRGAIDILRRSDRTLYLRTARKMVNHLCWTGIDGGQALLREMYGEITPDATQPGETNVAGPVPGVKEGVLLSGKPFDLASEKLGDDEVLSLIQAWIVEDKASFLPRVLNNPRSSLLEVAESLRRFHLLVADGAELDKSTMDGLNAALIRRFLSEQLDLISIAKKYLRPSDFLEVLDRTILSRDSYGKIGGKSSGLFLAEKILRANAGADRPIGSIKTPRSWYVASEEIVNFIEYNDLEEVMSQRYREVEQVRREYPNIVKLFKSSRFPPDLVRGLSVLLDEVGEAPLIVRSSSLLEDRVGAAFSGKYKSLFLPNQGPKQGRLSALIDAIAEVYASVFGPDPIAYRHERGLVDFHEEMGILIQEVVGRRVGDFFFPALAGVAFSYNEFRWSPRIRREDGLLRLVPGLGTRAVDRVSNDYPTLVVASKPTLRVNATIDELIRYSPQQIDVLNLATNRFETHDLDDFLRIVGTEFPAFQKVFSVVRDDTLQRPIPLLVDTSRDTLVADFNGLITDTPFVRHVGNMLKILQEALGTPVDIEFAWDGRDFYLLQCRSQSFSAQDAPAPIPRDLSEDDLIFSAKRHISNGRVPDITHIVHVDPDAYGALTEHAQMMAVGHAVSRLNKLLPKRQFILMGPGRWGSRGDIRLGVPVTYSDINNAAVLIEIARQRGDYVPDLSFGTHFFQDLVESSIRYIPLYPDDADGFLNQAFLLRAPNLLAEMAPEHAALEHVVRVIDVKMATRGRVLRVLMNADLDEAVGVLASPDEDQWSPPPATGDTSLSRPSAYWRWRLHMAERIAEDIDPERFGVVAMYIIGSVKNANAGPASDLDVLIHVRGTDEQRRELETFLQGWSRCLGEINYLRTGYATRELLDVHYLTDADIAANSSFASKIGAITDAALQLPLRRRDGSPSA
jgi:predicted nucleotidyltransferase